jgi:hypothetical protein
VQQDIAGLHPVSARVTGLDIAARKHECREGVGVRMAR